MAPAMDGEPGMSKHDQPFDYRHRFKAGNLGDVFKHVALGAVLRALTRDPAPLTVVDTHAGGGRYVLGPTGEWTAGVGRFDAGLPADAPDAVRRWHAAAGRRTPNRGGTYPGSPRFVLDALRPGDRLVLVELIDEVRADLERHLDDARVEVRGGDGLAALRALHGAPGRLLAFVDPPFTRKAEWDEVADALIALHAARPDAPALLWYPIKSLARPNALHRRLQDAGVPALTLDLVTASLERRKKALNGSGLVVIGSAAALEAELLGLAPTLGPALTTDGAWELRARRWGLPAA